MTNHSDAELVKKSRKTAEKLSENLYIIGNEPTLACYRIQEHVHKSGPMIIDKGTEMRRLSKQLQSCCHGLDYSIKAIRGMEGGRVHLQNTTELITNSLFFKQQLDYEQARIREQQQGASSSPAGPPRSGPPPASERAARFAQRLSGSFDLHSSSLSSLANSASQMVNQFQSQSSNSPTSRTRPHENNF